mmetsp:Transcript_9416/g.42706  ORF Transcript_9416/g.42706 Transcript_9416/m.42706 type:complete len:456 (+) Transcript_9416:3165-4532(+)
MKSWNEILPSPEESYLAMRESTSSGRLSTRWKWCRASTMASRSMKPLFCLSKIWNAFRCSFAPPADFAASFSRRISSASSADTVFGAATGGALPFLSSFSSRPNPSMKSRFAFCTAASDRYFWCSITASFNESAGMRPSRHSSLSSLIRRTSSGSASGPSTSLASAKRRVPPFEAAAAASASPGPENLAENPSRILASASGSMPTRISSGTKPATKPAKVMRPVVGSAFAAKSAERTSAGGTMRKLARTARNSDSFTAPSPSASNELNARRNAAEPPSNFWAILSTMSSRIAATSPPYVATSLAGLGFPWRLRGGVSSNASSSSPRFVAPMELKPITASRKVRWSTRPLPPGSSLVITAATASSVALTLNLRITAAIATESIFPDLSAASLNARCAARASPSPDARIFSRSRSKSDTLRPATEYTGTCTLRVGVFRGLGAGGSRVGCGGGPGLSG